MGELKQCETFSVFDMFRRLVRLEVLYQDCLINALRSSHKAQWFGLDT